MMKRLRFPMMMLVMLLLGSCAMKVDDHAEKQKLNSENEALLLATLYQQTAAEKDALCLQAFNWATKVIQNDMKRMGLSKRQAVVVDIDETVLNNSPYEAECILSDINYPERWDEWLEASEAKPLPGAVDFLSYAVENGYEVFYITNRKEIYREATLRNLQKFDFPNADNEHLMMRTETSSKDARRKKVTENYRIVLLMGDNLSDFATIFDQQTVTDRQVLVMQNKEKFGFEYIALPNAMYGAWLDALFNYNNDLSFNEKRSLMIKHLRGF